MLTRQQQVREPEIQRQVPGRVQVFPWERAGVVVGRAWWAVRALSGVIFGCQAPPFIQHHIMGIDPQEAATVAKAACERAEGYLALGMPLDAWEALESLPSETKVLLPVLELRMECLIAVKSWEKAEILGESLAPRFPHSRPLWLGLARARCQLGRLELAREAVTMAGRADPARKLELLDDPLLAAIYT